MNLRNAKNSDLEITYRIKSKSIKEYVEKIWGWNEPYQKEIHKKKFIASETKIIEQNQQKIGYLVLKETENEIYIENLLIEKEFQNLGIGKEVMEKIIEKANSEKKLIRLQVFKINIKAQKFYGNLGFEKTSEMKNHIEMKKKKLDTTPYPN
ncbi:GNAT family N-acetyltransferase [Mariniflexile sp.]|uniref:GNAT family N-acetyltransferase n=1 Tax=Mariniflexile sp. TaxID=1979402 RepID=UPI004048A68E